LLEPAQRLPTLVRLVAPALLKFVFTAIGFFPALIALSFTRFFAGFALAALFA